MVITIRALRADVPSDVEWGHRIKSAAEALDVPDVPPPSLRDFAGSLLYPYPGDAAESWLAEADGVPAGLLTLYLPQLENLGNVGLTIRVHPDHQRHGIGRTLFEHTRERVRDLGRKRLQFETVEALPGGPERIGAGTAFARAIGAHAALPSVRRRLDLDRTPDLDGMLAEARSHADGYSLIQWHDAAPEEYVDQLAALDSGFVLEVPLGDLTLEPEKIDATRLRAGEEVNRKRGRRRFHTAARHDATDRLVGWTTIAFDADEYTLAWQYNTLVVPAHRGHRLGLVIKIENLRYSMSHEAAMRQVNTWNAAENVHMIAVNEQMGFRPVDAWYDWQLEL